jgi:signal transduction histidine kinase
MSFRAVACDEVLQHALANLHRSIQESEAEITSDPLPIVRGNATLLMHLFQNLIGNAIKFSRDEPPRVHISAAPSDQGWRFSVRDNGIGMDTKDLKKIFQVFQQLHAQDLFPGTGIGLAICKAIVERHGGEIWPESEKGVGSVFYFTLPTCPAE